MKTNSTHIRFYSNLWLLIACLYGICQLAWAADLPDLGKGMATDATGATVPTQATFKGGNSVNGGLYQTPVTQSLSDTADVVGEITVDATDVGKTADIFVYAETSLQYSKDLYYFMLGEGLTILEWDMEPAHLVAFVPQVKLNAIQAVPIYKGTFFYPGTLKVFFGYRLDNGTVVFSGQPVDITIGIPEVKEPEYSSVPPPENLLTFDYAIAGCSGQVVYITNLGQAPLTLNSASLTGTNASDFKLQTTFPLTIAPAQKDVPVIVTCAMSDQTVRTAELKLSTNDPNHLTPTYFLTYTGIRQPGELKNADKLTSVDHAVAGNEYISNPITLSGLKDGTTVTVTGNSRLIKNGQEVSSPAMVIEGDTLALKTRAGTSGTTTVGLNIGDKPLNWSVTTAAIEPLKAVAGNSSGYTAGQFEVNESGAATYSIPITVPPGTAGMQPTLSLAYSSQGSNGLLGLGWSMSGLSTITRCPATRAQDNGLIDGVDFDGNDRFCLDGERLMAIQGVYGEDKTEYRTEQQSFRRVISSGKVGDAPEKFKVWTKAGLIMEYGFTEDSRIEAQGKPNVLFWVVNKIEDTKGNYLTISYEENNANGEYQPIRIDYTGNLKGGLNPYNSVHFFYEDRPDIIPKYLSGSLLKTTKRLNRLEVYEGADLFRKYQVAYQPGAITNRSRLVSVTECGTNNSCFAPTTFTWQDEKASFGTPTQWLAKDAAGGFPPSSYNGDHEAYVDLNGDGIVDKAWVPNGSTDLWIALGTGSSFKTPEKWLTKDATTGALPYASVKSLETYADMNGDGIPDKVWVPSGLYDLYVALGTGKGFKAPTKWLAAGFVSGLYPYSGGGYYEAYVDLNGDGRTDKVWVPSGSNDLWVAIASSTGIEFKPPEKWLPVDTTKGIYPYSYYGLYESYVDVNGDGLPDKVWVPNGVSDLYVALSTGSGFKTPEKWLSAGFVSGLYPYSGSGVHTRYTDLNGDGLTDLAWIPSGSHDLWVALSTGSGFKTPEKWLQAGFISGLYPYSSGGYYDTYVDVNGDGLADKVWVPYPTQDLYVAFSTGSGFKMPEKWIPAEVAKGFYPFSYNGLYESYADLNGDGIADKVWVPYGKTELWAALGNVSSSNLLSAITTGHGAVTTLTYKPLTDNSIYTKETNAVYPQIDIQLPVYVVASYKTTNGVGGENQVSYRYVGAKMDLKGRGFRGFTQTTMTDEQTGISNITFYDRDYRYINTKVRRTEQRLSTGTLLKETDNTTELKDYGNGVNFSRVKQSVTKEYELDASLVTTTTTTNQYDDFGNPTQIIVDYGSGYTETTTNTYTNDTVNWILGRLTKAVVSKNVLGQPSQTRTSAFEYDLASGLLTKEIIEPDKAELRLEKSYQHDAFGNILQSITSAAGLESRSVTTVYDPQGRYVLETSNALNHKETKTYNLGNVISSTGPNGLTTSWQYDGFGRPVLETRADGTQTQTAYRLCDANNPNCPSTAKYFVRTDISGAAPKITYFDLLDRKVREETVGFDGRAIFTDIQYNARGEIIKVSDPYFAGGTPNWTVNEYDAVSRVVKSTAPGDRATTSTYKGLVTLLTNPLGQKTTQTINPLKQLLKSEDHLGNATTYIYDGFGNLIELRDSAGNVTTLEYDLRGNKTRMYDRDTGMTSYTYNAFGEQVSQTDAKNQVVKTEYDKLGRMVKRTDHNEGDSTWTYDTQPKGIGKLAVMSGPKGNYQENYAYDNFGQLVATTTTIGGQKYFVNSTYDQYGRPETLTYPTGLAVKNVYNAIGYLAEVRADKTTYWKADKLNARGQLEQVTLGNGLATTKVYDPLTGLLQQIQTGAGTGVVQNLGFTFDKLGNLTQRTNRHLTETFQYDGLNRLTQSAVQGGYSTTITYDALGNILSKSDVGTYTYGGTSPHAVTAVNGAVKSNYTYDANGNRLTSSATGQKIDYTSFNKSRRITQGTTTLEFLYSPTYDRYQQTVTKNSITTTTTYLSGGLYEQELSQGFAKGVHYIFANGESVAVYTKSADGKESTRYLHKDHLGSIETITDEQGQKAESLSFDSWGQRRSDNWGVLTPAELQALLSKDFTTHRGFTGHEQLDEVQLIDMKGRVYDPVLGRFLNADPFIQDPTNGQSLNRYSYVMNNPLSFTDPSGFFSLKKIFKGIVDFVKPIVAVVAGIALGVVTGGIGLAVGGALTGIASGAGIAAGITTAFAAGTSALSVAGFAGTVMSGAGFGFGSAFTGTLLGGGSIGDAFKAGLKGAVISGVTAGLNGVGNFFAPGALGSQNLGNAAPFDKIAAHGMVQGLSRVAQGGKFEHGFIDGVSNMFGRVVASAVVGGTTAELGGGKFANGAVSGAFVRLSTNINAKLKEFSDIFNNVLNNNKIDNRTKDSYNNSGNKIEVREKSNNGNKFCCIGLIVSNCSCQ